MPWKECSVMDERLRFVAQLLDGEAMSDAVERFEFDTGLGVLFVFRRLHP